MLKSQNPINQMKPDSALCQKAQVAAEVDPHMAIHGPMVKWSRLFHIKGIMLQIPWVVESSYAVLFFLPYV